jgi:hypothetical protein
MLPASHRAHPAAPHLQAVEAHQAAFSVTAVQLLLCLLICRLLQLCCLLLLLLLQVELHAQTADVVAGYMKLQQVRQAALQHANLATTVRQQGQWQWMRGV